MNLSSVTRGRRLSLKKTHLQLRAALSGSGRRRAVGSRAGHLASQTNHRARDLAAPALANRYRNTARSRNPCRDGSGSWQSYRKKLPKSLTEAHKEGGRLWSQPQVRRNTPTCTSDAGEFELQCNVLGCTVGRIMVQAGGRQFSQLEAREASRMLLERPFSLSSRSSIIAQFGNLNPPPLEVPGVQRRDQSTTSGVDP